jgi:ferredoxin
MDAVIGMEGNGPASPELREIGVVLAADNGVAMDGVIARMMGVNPAGLRFLQRAKNLGLGDFASNMLQLDGDLHILSNFKLPPLAGKSVAGNPEVASLMHTKAELRPEADQKLCTGCGACVDQCPVSALTMSENVPKVDREACITCFCCQEICPEKAMTLN